MRTILAILIFWSGLVRAQQLDTVYDLPEAVIDARLPIDIVRWDREDLQEGGQETLTDRLQDVATAFVRNYGPGSLGSLSLMGGTAAHTGIKWEGLSLRNPMLGQNDLSLMPTQLFEQVTIDVSGASAEYGSAQLNGTILLRNTAAEDEPKLVIAPEIGSWSREGAWSKFNWQVARVRSQTKLYGSEAQNDFEYQRSNGQRVRQSNANVRNYGALHKSSWLDAGKRVHEVAIWWQDAFQRVPPLTTQTNSEATQRTKSLRLALTMNAKQQGKLPRITAGMVRENLLYMDPAINLISENLYKTYSLEGEKKWNLGAAQQGTLRLGLIDSYLRADSQNYAQSRSENQLEIFAKHSSSIDGWALHLALRQGLVDERFLPTSASVKVEKGFGERFGLQMGFSRDTRFITLNERYWEPGGNPDLEEESSLAQIINLEWAGKRSGRKMTLRLFNRNTTQWILWTPQSNQLIWSPQNLSAVWSRGAALILQDRHLIGQVDLTTQISYGFTRSTNRDEIIIPRIPAGEQIFYTPRHRGTFRLIAKRKQLRGSYVHRYTGRYLGVSSDLSGFHVSQLRADWESAALDTVLDRIWLLIDNLWNTDYRMIENRPMPLRNVRIGVHLVIR